MSSLGRYPPLQCALICVACYEHLHLRSQVRDSTPYLRFNLPHLHLYNPRTGFSLSKTTSRNSLTIDQGCKYSVFFWSSTTDRMLRQVFSKMGLEIMSRTLLTSPLEEKYGWLHIGWCKKHWGQAWCRPAEERAEGEDRSDNTSRIRLLCECESKIGRSSSGCVVTFFKRLHFLVQTPSDPFDSPDGSITQLILNIHRYLHDQKSSPAESTLPALHTSFEKLETIRLTAPVGPFPEGKA